MLQYQKNKKHSHITYWASNQNKYNNNIHTILQKIGGRSLKNFSMNFVCKNTQHISFKTNNISEFYINGLWTEGFKM